VTDSLVSPALLKKASEEIDAMVSGLIPDGKKGAAILVVDANGAGIGMAMKHGRHLMIEATLEQRWMREKPTAQIRVKALW
jgi:hypothetical protein